MTPGTFQRQCGLPSMVMHTQALLPDVHSPAHAPRHVPAQYDHGLKGPDDPRFEETFSNVFTDKGLDVSQATASLISWSLALCLACLNPWLFCSKRACP